jgi:hypothetical protein
MTKEKTAQSGPGIQPEPKASSRPRKKPSNLWLIISSVPPLVLMVVAGYLFYQTYQLKKNQSLAPPRPYPPKVRPTSTPTPIKPTPVIKKLEYEMVADWPEFKSSTGYTIQHPPSFVDPDNDGEDLQKDTCHMIFGNNAGGILDIGVVPYDGGSRRRLYEYPEGYTYSFEDVIIQDKKALLIEVGPTGDSGSRTIAIIPVGNTAITISWSNRAKDDPNVLKLLKSIKLSPQLEISNCGQ